MMATNRTHLAPKEFWATLNKYWRRTRLSIQVWDVEVAFYPHLLRQSGNLCSNTDVHTLKRIVPVTETLSKDVKLNIKHSVTCWAKHEWTYYSKNIQELQGYKESKSAIQTNTVPFHINFFYFKVFQRSRFWTFYNHIQFILQKVY